MTDSLTIFISVLGVAVPSIVLIWTTIKNNKIQKDRDQFERDSNEKLAKLQTELNHINRNLELDQQFVIEKKKYLFELNIELINKFIESSSKASISFCNSSDIKKRIDCALEDGIKLSLLLKDSTEVVSEIEILTECYVVIADSLTKNQPDMEKINELIGETPKCIILLNKEKERLCNEGLETKDKG